MISQVPTSAGSTAVADVTGAGDAGAATAGIAFACVELAELPDGVIAVRNSRDPSGPALIYSRAEVSAFFQGAKDGEFDDLYQDGLR